MSDRRLRQFRSRGNRPHEGKRIAVHVGDRREVEVDFLRRRGEAGHAIYFRSGRPRPPAPSVLDARRTPPRLRQTYLSGARRPARGARAAPKNERASSKYGPEKPPYARFSGLGARTRSACPHFVQKRAPSLNCSAPHLEQTTATALISSPRAATVHGSEKAMNEATTKPFHCGALVNDSVFTLPKRVRNNRAWDRTLVARGTDIPDRRSLCMSLLSVR